MLKILFLMLPLFAQEQTFGLFFDFKNISEEKVECSGEEAPGNRCILHCITIANMRYDQTFDCILEGKGTFNERFSENILVSTDVRTVIIYPYQKTKICFNFGKTTTDYWELKKWEILNPNDSCRGILSD